MKVEISIIVEPGESELSSETMNYILREVKEYIHFLISREESKKHSTSFEVKSETKTEH